MYHIYIQKSHFKSLNFMLRCGIMVKRTIFNVRSEEKLLQNAKTKLDYTKRYNNRCLHSI